MSDDWGLLDKDGAAEPTCSVCEGELEWIECGNCEDGEHDAYELDPLWYDEGDTIACAQCGGAGGWYWCPTCKNMD